MLVQLLRDSAVILSVVFIVSYIKNLHFSHLEKHEPLLLGVTYAVAGVMAMYHPYMLSPKGVQFDSRAVFVGLAGLFGGWSGGLLALAVCVSYRLYLGGAGAPLGALAMILATGIGIAAHLYLKKKDRNINVFDLIIFSFLLSASTMPTLVSLPGVLSTFTYSVLSGMVFALYLFTCLVFGIFEVQEIKQRQRKRDLKESKIIFESAQRVGQIGVWMHLPDGTEHRVSSQVYRMMGIDPQEKILHEDDVFSRIDPEDRSRVRDSIRRTLAGRQPAPFQFRFRQGNGEERIVWCHLITAHGDILAKDGRPLIVWLLQDVTERNQLFDQLAHSAKLAMIGELSSSIGHEIANPLTASILLTGYLDRKLRQINVQEPEVFGLLSKLQQRLQNMNSLIRSMTSFVRLESQHLERIDAHNVVVETVNLFRELFPSDHLEMELDFLAPQHEITGDSSRLQQVLINLLKNAKDASANQPVSRIRIQTNSDGAELVIRVADNGDGMTEEVRRRVFDPFFTTKNRGKGTGLGLSIASSIVNQMRGRIDVKSGPSRGSEFSLIFPLAGV